MAALKPVFYWKTGIAKLLPMKNRLQFSVGTLLLVTALVAVVLWLTFRVPVAIGLPVLIILTITLPAFLAITTIYGDKSLRPFCIGALCALGTSFLGTGGGIDFNWKTLQVQNPEQYPLDAATGPLAAPDLDLIAAPNPVPSSAGYDSLTDSEQGFLGFTLLAAIATGFLCSLLQWWLTRNDRGEVLSSLAVPDYQAVRNAA